MFIIRPLSSPAPQTVTATYSLLSGSDVSIEAKGNATGMLRLKYNFSFACPAAESGSIFCKLQYSLHQSGLLPDWQVIPVTCPVDITAGQPFRADLDIPHTLLSGIPAGYELQYRMMVALEGGSGPVTVHNGTITASAHIDLAQGDTSTTGTIKFYSLANVGVSASAWGGVAMLMRSQANVGVTATAFSGLAQLVGANAAVGVSSEVITDWVDPIRIKPPQATEPIIHTLGMDWEPVSGTTILIEGKPGGWQPHSAALSFHVPCKAVGTNGGQADFKVVRSIDGGEWEDVQDATGSW